MTNFTRRHALATAAALSVAKGTAGAAEGETERFNAWLEDRFKFWIGRSPMSKAYLGIKEDMDKWDDLSDARERDNHELYRADIAKLKSEFDPATLTPAARLSHRLFALQTEQQIADFRWRRHDYPVNQMYGWQSEIPSFLINVHGVSSVGDAEAYIARLNGVGALMDQLIAGIEARAAAGVMPPKFVHAHVLRDIRNVLKGAPFDSSGKDSTLLEDFRGKVEALTADAAVKAKLTADAEKALIANFRPAFEKLIAVVEAEEKKAITDDGVWKLPDGAEYYRHMLRQHTTTDMTASQIHDLGLAEVARIHDEMRAIMSKVGFSGDLKAFFKFMKDDPQFYFPQNDAGKAAYMKGANDVIEAMRARLDEVFLTKPKAQLTVKAVEPFREQSAASAFYQPPGAFDGRPGIYYANTYDMRSMPKFEIEALAYHEAIPGHHMQIAIAQELEGVPSFRKFSTDYTAYVEGWGLYCEKLPTLMGGFYTDPYSDFGRLSMELWRACRLVTDTGLHADTKRWTRAKAIQFMFDNTPTGETEVVTEIERYIVMPGQATAYKIGMNKLIDLREKARKGMGAKFDIRRYHDLVLLAGPVPLTVLEELVDDMIATAKPDAPVTISVTAAEGYIHTFTPAEQARLIAQADFLEPYHHVGIDLAGCRRVLEIGCGVGAQMRILARRWPEAHLIGIDRSEVQLSRAREVLRDVIAAGRAAVHLATGDGLPLDDRTVDAVCVFWVFEHVADPRPILDDAYRVLAPGGRIVTTEVFDRALYTWPACPAIAAYFAAFTTLQREFGGDPDVGLRMPGLLSSAGFTEIVMADVSPVLDHRMPEPAARKAFVDYFSDLMLSGADPLTARGRIASDLPAAVRAEFAAMIGRRDAVFSYGAKQISARRPA